MTAADPGSTDPVRMSFADAAWLGMDSPDNLMMVTAVLHLDEDVDRERLAQVLEHRLLARYPKFSMRPVPSRGPFGRPAWTADPDFDLGRHVLDAGTCPDDEQLGALVSDLLSRPLDMHHSPWQFHLVERLPRRPGGRRKSAVVARLHHCLADGIALASVLLSLTDDHPDAGPGSVEGPTQRPAPPRPARQPPVAALRRAARSVRFGWRVLTTGLGLLFAARDPRTRLHGRLGRDKCAAWTAPLDLGQLKRVAKELDATVNDVLMAVTAGALRRHLLSFGERAHDLRVFVPVDLRPPDTPVPPELGNRFGLVFVRLPVSVPDPVARVHAVRGRMDRVKASAQATSTFAIVSVVGALPSWGHRLAVRVLGAKSAAVATNVPGPRDPVFLAGARLKRLVFWVPQAGSVGLGVSILSYAGDVTVGVAADRNLVPDPGVLTRAVEDEVDDLVRSALPVDGEVELREVGFDSPLARSLIDEVQQEYVRRYGGRDDTPVDPGQFAAPDGTFLVALLAGQAIGCAGMRRRDADVVELKRMFVRLEHRRRGHARRMLAALEDWARGRGYRQVLLETGLAQPEAISLYESAGYAPVPGFGHYKDSKLSRSFARDL